MVNEKLRTDASGQTRPKRGEEQPGRRAANALRLQLQEAEAKAAENLDGWQRALAEFQNYRKRIERDRVTDQASDERRPDQESAAGAR